MLLNSKKFKKLSDNCFITIKQFNLLGVIIAKNSLVYENKDENTIYICKRFPRNYKGSLRKMRLPFLWVDIEASTIGDIVIGGEIVQELYFAWLSSSCPKQCVYHKNTMQDYSQMMKHERVKKKGSGGVRLLKDASQEMTDAIRHRQSSQYAYYKYLGVYDEVL